MKAKTFNAAVQQIELETGDDGYWVVVQMRSRAVHMGAWRPLVTSLDPYSIGIRDQGQEVYVDVEDIEAVWKYNG